MPPAATIQPGRISLSAAPTMQDASITVDAERGIIGNCALLTIGKALPANAPPFRVDRQTLADAVALVNAAKGRLRVRLSHPELDGADGISSTVGTVTNARLVGDSARCDVQLGAYAKTMPGGGNAWAYLTALASEQPQNLGISLFIDDMTNEDTPSGPRARLHRLFAADIVGEPGGNPRGLLARATTAAAAAKGTGTMNADQLAQLRAWGLPADATAEQVAEFVAALAPEQRAEIDGLAGSGAAAPAPAAAATAAAGAADRPALTRAQVREINDLAVLGGLGDSWAMRQVIACRTPAEARHEAMAARQAAAPGGIATVPAERPQVVVGVDRRRQGLAAGIRDAILLRAFKRSGRKWRGDAPHELANGFTQLRLTNMARRYFGQLNVPGVGELSDKSVSELALSRKHRRRYALRVGLTAGDYDAFVNDFTNVLDDSQNKSLQMAYEEVPVKWPAFCTQGSAPDFRTISRPQVGSVPPLEETGPGEVINFGTIGDSKETYAVVKRTSAYVYTWEQFVNDDVGVFDRLLSSMAHRCRMAQDALCFGILTTNADMSDGFPLFSQPHANFVNEGGGVPTVLAIEAMQALAAAQFATGDANEEPLDLQLGVVIVPETMRARTSQVLFGAVDPASQGAAANPWENQFVLVSSARLTGTNWYMAVKPGGPCETIELAFLEGQEAPELTTEEDFDSVAIKQRCIQSFGAKALDWRGLVRNDGTSASETVS